MSAVLPTEDGRLFVTDGGMETTLIYRDGFELPQFATFPLLDDDAGTEALRSYYASYAQLAAELGAGVVLDTVTWRANSDCSQPVMAAVVDSGGRREPGGGIFPVLTFSMTFSQISRFSSNVFPVSNAFRSTSPDLTVAL